MVKLAGVPAHSRETALRRFVHLVVDRGFRSISCLLRNVDQKLITVVNHLSNVDRGVKTLPGGAGTPQAPLLP